MSFVRSSVEFERHCEFWKLQDGYATCMKTNKSPTVSHGVRVSSFEIWTTNLAQLLTVELHLWRFKLKILQSRLPQNLTFRCAYFQLGIYLFFTLLFLREKNQNLLDIQEQCIRKLGKIRSKPKLLFGVYYWFLKLNTGIIWHSYFPFNGIYFVAKGQQLIWGQVG